jgi:hypothetical protein
LVSAINVGYFSAGLINQLYPKVIAALLVGPMESERNVSLLSE